MPNLTKLSQEIINVTQELEVMRNSDDSESLTGMSIQLRKRKVCLEKKAQLFMRELMMAKLITDFRIQMHLATGATSSSKVRELTHELLPFAM